MTPAPRPASDHELREGAAQIAADAPDVEKPRLLTVQEAITRVLSELPNIGKGDKSPEGYTYRGIEAITKHVQPLFAKHGVVIVPQARVMKVVPSPAMKDGWQDVHVEVVWTIVGPDGSRLNAMTSGIGRDRSDKGANKGQTQAFKYLLLHMLCIADGKDDSDNQSYEHDRREAAPWNVNQTKAHLQHLLDGDKTAAKEAWTAGHGDDGEPGPELAERLAQEWRENQPADPASVSGDGDPTDGGRG